MRYVLAQKVTNPRVTAMRAYIQKTLEQRERARERERKRDIAGARTRNKGRPGVEERGKSREQEVYTAPEKRRSRAIASFFFLHPPVVVFVIRALPRLFFHIYIAQDARGYILCRYACNEFVHESPGVGYERRDLAWLPFVYGGSRISRSSAGSFAGFFSGEARVRLRTHVLLIGFEEVLIDPCQRDLVFRKLIVFLKDIFSKCTRHLD